MNVTENREEYLEAIYKLAVEEEGATVTRIARELGVKPASVSEMLGRMVEAGVVERDQRTRGRVHLTAAGHTEALRLVRRHRLSERFLTDCLEIPWDEVHEEACRFEHVLSDAVEARLTNHLGRPLTCPHGRPIPYDGEEPTPESTRTLVDCAPGETCTVTHLSDESPDFLRYVASLGLLPGNTVAVREVEPFEGPLTVEVDGARRALGREVARKVFID